MKNISYKKILVSHDGSKLASAVLPHAITLARMYDAEVLLVHAINSASQESLYMSTVGIGMNPPVTTLGDTAVEIVKDHKRRAKKELEKLTTIFEDAGVKKVKICIDEGIPHDVILNVAKVEKCDLIIIATHGRSGVERVLLGSVADHVIRHAICPLLVVHPNQKTQKKERKNK